MPGLFTHTYILYRALRAFNPTSPLLKKVVASNNAVQHYNVHDRKFDYHKSADCLLASCAYIGACGPDLYYLETGSQGTFIADLMHYNKTGMYVVSCLRSIKAGLARPPAPPKFWKQLAYCLGHASHIAADINIHPYVNSIVAAYPDNGVNFAGAEATGALKGNMWKFHNILEHYQDSYVFYKLFVGDEGFVKDWESVNIASAASRYLADAGNADQRFLVANSKKFYRYRATFDATYETVKYEFFKASSWVPALDVQSYFNHVIPDESRMSGCQRLVQGGTFSAQGKRLSKGLFDDYIDKAVQTTLQFWGEIDAYLCSTEKLLVSDVDMLQDKKFFPQLGRHWNLDTGLALGVDDSPTNWELPDAKNADLKVVGSLRLESVHVGEIADVAF